MGEAERRPDADELADADAEVRDQHGHRGEHRPADPVLLADQLGEPLAGDRPHPAAISWTTISETVITTIIQSRS